jgi:hypothetical protein
VDLKFNHHHLTDDGCDTIQPANSSNYFRWVLPVKLETTNIDLYTLVGLGVCAF